MESLATSLAFAILLLPAGCGTTSAEGETDAASKGRAPNPPAAVRVEIVRKEMVAPKIIVIGTLRASRVSIVASASDGVVDQLGENSLVKADGKRIEKGDFVAAGSVLSVLRMKSSELEIKEQTSILAEREAEFLEVSSPRSEDVKEARARLQAAEAILKMADRRAKEQRLLLKNSAVGESVVRDSEDQLLEATQNHAAAFAAFERISAGAREETRLQAKARRDAQDSHVEYLKEEQNKRTTRAPFDGIVTEIHAELGQWLAKGSPVVTLVDMNSVEVEVQVDQNLIGQIQPGGSVQIAVRGVPCPGVPDGRWAGTVRAIVPKSEWESGSRSFPVIVQFVDVMPGEEKSQIEYMLREGMMAEVEFAGTPVDALLVPKDSLVRSDKKLLIYAINPPIEGQPLSVRQLVVTTGVSQAGWIEVKCDGLQAGDQVVSYAGERLRAFAQVVIQPNVDDSSTAPPQAEK
ncbi:MAG: efflux RND transporter periplasmic adaptor subunit [Planctomyces sp.]|nr:efflux RND transporter periplasmic adaptor subunit [Planctomyces sp.]